MSSDASEGVGRRLTTAGISGPAATAAGGAGAARQDEDPAPRPRRGGRGVAAQDGAATPRSRRISEEVAVGSSVARSPDYDEAKGHSLIQVIEHIFKGDENPDAGYPVAREQPFPIKPATKLVVVTISGFEFWFGTTQQEIMAGSSRYGFHAALEADFPRAMIVVKVRANHRFFGRVDRDWAWRCRVVVQCFGEN
jgi:hypothetical protein